MAGMLLRRLLLVLTAILAWAWAATPLPACPFCPSQGSTLTTEVSQATMVLYGTMKNAKIDKETTELHIDAVIKSHDILNDPKVVTKVGDKKVLVLKKYVPTDNDGKYKFLVFCDVYKGNVDPYSGRAARADSNIDKYLAGALAIKDKDAATRLRFFFDYLDHSDTEVSSDAFKEWANAEYKDYREMAAKLPADTIVKWMQDPKTPGFRMGTYGSLLGHCGKKEHAQLLRSLIDDPKKRVSTGIDGILAGYILLDPKEGWAYLRSIMKDANAEFMFRYAALRAARFFWEYRPDVVDKKNVVEGVGLLLDQNDIADLAIEDLRKWGRWEEANRVIELYDRKSHDIPIIRRSILRFALSCPDNPKAADLVQRLRNKDPDMVKDAEELLKLENGSQTNPPSDSK